MWLVRTLVGLALVAAGSVGAAPVTETQAKTAVAQLIALAPAPLGADLSHATRGGTVGDVTALGATRATDAYAYVVALNPEGYVVVSGDDRINPIIAFSAAGTFDPSASNPLAVLLSEDLPARLAAIEAGTTVRGGDLSAIIAANEAKWAALTAEEGTRAAGTQVVTEVWVDSFVQSRWNQSTEGGRACYNYYTPLIDQTSYTFDPGNPANVVTGCAATATAQMIRYFEWPEAGIGYKTGGGSVTYYYQYADPEGASLAGTQLRGGNGNGGPYDWDAMTLDPTGTESEYSFQQIGALCFDAGLSINMSYNIERSGMSGANFSSGAFISKFNYSGASGAGGANGMRANFDARRPVAITIGMTSPLLPPPGGGHAIVGDGYGRIDGRWYYHFNMGWGGSGNLWYNVEEYYYDSVTGGTEWSGLGTSVGNVYRKSTQTNEDAATGKIISGRVTDAAGNPVPGVAVEIQLAGSGTTFLDMFVWNDLDTNGVGRNTTDENGIWAIDKVPVGTYDIVMTRTGLAFSGPKEVIVGTANQWGLNFVATADTGLGELGLANWYFDYDNFVAGAAFVILEFNRPVGDVAVDPTALSVNGTALTGGTVFQSAASPLVVVLLNVADTVAILGLGPVALTLDMARDFLEIDVDGEGSQAGEDEATVIPVAPLVTGGAENPGFPINPVMPRVTSTELLVDGAVLPDTANPYATKESPVQFLVTFDNPVLGVDADDFSLRVTKDFVNVSTWPFETYDAKPDTPLPSAVIVSVEPTDATGNPAAAPSNFWTVTVNMGYGDGFVRLDVIDNDTISTAGGTLLGGLGANNGDFFYSEFAYRYDNHGPIIVGATLDPSNTYVTITWNEPVGSTNSREKTSNFSDMTPQYRWRDTNGSGGQNEGDALWLDRDDVQDNTFYKREDDVLMEPPFTVGLVDGQARTGQFRVAQAVVPVLGTTTIARVCYIELDGVPGCSAGDGLFFDIGVQAGLSIDFDDTFTPGYDLWFWPSGGEPASVTGGAQVPPRTSYYAENGALPVPSYSSAMTAYQAWITAFYAGTSNGIWLDYGPADGTYNVGDIDNGFVDSLIMGTAPADGDGGNAMPANAMYRDTNHNGLLDATDYVWLDSGTEDDALDGSDNRLDSNGEPLPGALFTNSLQVILTKNGGTVTSVGISEILNGDGTAMTDANDTIRAVLKFTPDLDSGGTAPEQLNEHRIPAGVETIEIVPVADSVFDVLGNIADTQTTTGAMQLYDTSVPRIVNVILADDNYSAKVVFSERVYTNPNGISNHNPQAVSSYTGNLIIGDFTVTTDTGAVTVTSFTHTLGTNYCTLYFGGTAAGRQLVDPAANAARTTLTVSVAANSIFDLEGNAVPATSWPVSLRQPYDVDNPDTMPPRCFTNGDGAYRREMTLPTPVEASTATDAEGLTYHGIYYRDLDGDCRVDAVDLNFRNPYPGATSPALYAGTASAASKFRVWVQNSDPEDTSHAANEENLDDVPDADFTGTLPWPASVDWTEVTVTGASVFSASTYYSTIRVTINQSQVRPRTHGRRWVMISYDDPDDRMDGIPPTTNANTTYETDGVYWFRSITGNPDPADWYWVVADFPPTMAWDGAPARPVAATMWRTANFNKSNEASSAKTVEANYNSYDYLDIVFSEPLSSVGDTGWTPAASYGSGSNVDEKKGPYGPEIVDLLSGTGQTVRIWYNSTSVTSRTIAGGSAAADAQVVDAAGNRNTTPYFTGTAIGVRNLDSRYNVLGFQNDSAWVGLLAVDSEGAQFQQYTYDSNSVAGASQTLNANRVTLRGFDQGGFNASSDAYWYQSNTSTSYALAGFLNRDLANANASIVFSAAANNSSVKPGDAFVGGISELRVRNANLTTNPEIPGMVPNVDGVFAMAPPTVVESGPVYCMAKVSASFYNGTSRLDERERSVLDIDVAGRTTDRIETITVRVIDTSYGQFDPETDLLPLADDATSGVRLYKLFDTTGLVQLAAGGMEWSEWRVNAEGQPYREVVLRPLTAQSVPQTDLDPYTGAEYQIRVATSNAFNLGDSFIVEIPDDGILFQRGSSQDDFPSNWAIGDGTPGLAMTGHVYEDVNGDGRWNLGETIMDIEDAFQPVPFYDAGVPYEQRTQTSTLLSVVGEFQRNLYYAKRGASPNPDTVPEPAGAEGDSTDTDYNVVYSPGDAVWYDIGGTLGVYDAGVDIPLFSNSDLFHSALSPHEEGSRSVQIRGAAPAAVASALPAGTIAAGSEPTAVLGIDMQDSGRGFAPRFPFGQTGGVVVEAVSKNLKGGVYTKKLVYSVAAHTLAWNGGTAVDVSADGRYILAGASGTFLVVDVTAASLPAENASIDVTVSADVDRDIQQPAAIRGLRVHGVGPGNVVGETGTLHLSGTELSWQSDNTDGGTEGDPVDVSAGGVFVLNAERVDEADYLIVQVDSIYGASSEDLAIYPADGRVITPLRTITGLEIMAVSDVVAQGEHTVSWDGSSSLSWSDGSPTDITGAAGTLTLVPGNTDGTSFLVVRRTIESLPVAATKDVLFINQTRLLRVAVSVSDVSGFTSTHLRALTADNTSGIALYRDANANGVFDGSAVDEFVPLAQTPTFSGSGTYTLTLYPDPTSRASYLPNSHVAPHSGNDFFLAVQTTYDMSYGDRFSVYASVYEPTEPNADLSGSPSFAGGSSGTITCTSVTNTVYEDKTSSPWTVDAGTAGTAAPVVLFGIDHFLGATGSIDLQSMTFTLHSVNGFDPADDLMAMDAASAALRGVMLYADTNTNGVFNSAADTLIPCDIVTDYDSAAGTYTFTLLPITAGTATKVPVSSDGGLSDHFVCINLAPGLDYGDEFYCTVEVDGIEYSSGVGNAASRLQTHNLSATIKSRYGDLTSRVQTTLTSGLVVTGIGSGVSDGYQQVQLIFDPATNAYYLVWNSYSVVVDMLGVGSYTIGAGTNTITVTLDPLAFAAEDTLVDGDGDATTAAGIPDDVALGAALLPVSTVPAGVLRLYYVDADENGMWDQGEAIVLVDTTAPHTTFAASDTVVLGSASLGDALTAFGAVDRMGFYDADGNGEYTNGEDLVRDTDGYYTLPWLDTLLDTDGGGTVGTGGGTLLVEGDALVSASVVSVATGAAVSGYAGLYYFDADGSGGYTAGDDIVARPATGGVIVGALTFAATDVLLYDGDDNGDGDDDDAADEVQVQIGDTLSQFVAADYVAFEQAGTYPNGYELREDIFRSTDDVFSPTDYSWSFRVTNGTRAIRRYDASAPVPFNDPEDAMTAVVGIDVANSGASGVTLDKLTLRFDNLYQFNATIDLRALTSGSSYAGTNAGVLIYRDADGNGRFNPAIDTLVQPANAPSWTSAGTEYRVTFNFDSDNLVDDEDTDGIFDFFVVVQPDEDANNYQEVDDGDQFRVRILNGDLVLSKALNVTSVTSDTLTIDSLPPQLTVSADINDADSDGYLDSVVFTFHENLQPGNEDAADWTLTDADGTDLSPTSDTQIALDATYRVVTVALADIDGTTGKINCKTLYDADALGLLDWAGNPVDFTSLGISSADDVPPIVLHSGIVVDSTWSVADGSVGTSGDLCYHDRNDNGVWDAGEDIWQDRVGGTDGQYDEGTDRRIWNGGDAWTTVDGYSARAIQTGLYFYDTNANGTWDAAENIWADVDTDPADSDLDGEGVYDDGTDEQVFVHRGEDIEVVDLDGNGRVDAMAVTLSEKVNESTLAGYYNHWTNISTTRWFLSGRTGLQIDPNGPQDLAASSMDKRHLYFVFDEAAVDSYDTGATPALTTVGATLADVNGNILNGGTNYGSGDLTVDDHALPILVSAGGDTAIANGNVVAGTKITLKFSEPMAQFTALDLGDFVTDPDGTGAFAASPAFEGKGATLSIDSLGQVVITLTEDTTGGNWTEDLTIAVNTGIADHCVGDLAGNNMLEGGDAVPIRGMGSVLVTEVVTMDTNANGFIDGLRITFDRNINDLTLQGYATASTLIDVANNGNHWQVAGRDGTVYIDPNGPQNNDTVGNNVLYLVFSPEGGSPDTGAKPALTISGSALSSFNSEPVDEASVPATTDGAAPQIMDVSAYDQNADGGVDTVRIDFSEPMDDSTVTPGDYTIGGKAATEMDRIRLRTVSYAGGVNTIGTVVRHGLKTNDQIVINLVSYVVASVPTTTSFTVVAGDLSAQAGSDAYLIPNYDSIVFLSTDWADQAPGTAYQTVAYTQGLVPTADYLAGNLLGNRTDAGLGDRYDYAPPRVLSATSLTDSTLAITFSETVTTPNLGLIAANVTLGPAISFATVDMSGNPTLVFSATATWNTGATGLDGDATSGTDSDGDPRGDVRTDFSLVAATVNDTSTQANANQAVTFTGTADGAVPVIVACATDDTNTDGDVDQALVTFSEQVQNVVAGEFRLEGVVVESAGTTDNYVWTFGVPTAQVPGTDYAELAYVGSSCDDLSGNPLATGSDLGLAQTDLAEPMLLSASTVDDRTVLVSFSEPLVNASSEISTAAASFSVDGATVFGSALVDDGSGTLVSTDGQGDLSSFYLRMTDGTTWNTDATGSAVGVGLDSAGVQQAVMPGVYMAVDALFDSAGNGLLAASYTGTTDGAPPVVVEVTAAAAQQGQIFGAEDNVFIKVLFSEELFYNNAGGAARLTVQTGSSSTANVLCTGTDTDGDSATVLGLVRGLAFTYTVADGDNRVYPTPGYFEYAATTSLAGNGAVIQDSVPRNDADLALPTIVADGSGMSLSSAQVEIDTLPPNVASAATVDDDTVELTFDEPVQGDSIAAAVAAGKITLGGSLAYDAVTVAADGTVTDLVSGTSYTVVYLQVATAAKRWNTDATGSSAGGASSTDSSGVNRTNIPSVNIVAALLMDRPGNTMAATAFTGTTDGAAPCILAGAYQDTDTEDVPADGLVDLAVLTFSEPVSLLAGSGWTLTPNDLDLDTTLGTFALSADYCTLTIGLTPNSVDTGVDGGTEPTLTYVGSGSIVDQATSPNDLAGTTVALADEAGPAIASAAMVTPNLVEVTFSEIVNPATLDAADFVHSLATVSAVVAVDGGAKARLTLDTSLDLDATATVGFSAADVVEDNSGNGNAQVATVAVTSLDGRLAISSPETSVVYHGSSAVDVEGLVNVADSDLASWTLSFAQGHLATPLEAEGGWASIGTDTAAVTSTAKLGEFIPDTHADTGINPPTLLWTLVLKVTFENGSVAIVYREIFVSEEDDVLGTVLDGSTGVDIDFQGSSSTVSATWSGLDQGVLTPTRYEMSVGTTPLDEASADWHDMGTATSGSVSGLSLLEETKYYTTVRAVDGDGNTICWQSSDGFMVDLTAPTEADVRDGADAGIDLIWLVQDHAFGANWDLFVDAGSTDVDPDPATITGSGTVSYELAVYLVVNNPDPTSGETDDTLVGSGFASVGNVLYTEREFGAGTFVHGSVYYAAVRATDAVGNVSDVAYSDGVTVDLEAPATTSILDGDVAGTDIDLTNSADSLWANWQPFVDAVSGPPAYELTYKYRVVTGLADVATWQTSATTSAMTQSRQHFTSVRLADGRLLVAGGWSGTTVLASAEIFDPETATWTAVPSMATARMNAAGVLLADRRVVVAGGENTTDYVSTVEIYDPDANTWTTAVGTLIKKRAQFSAVAMDTGEVWFIAGRGAVDAALPANGDCLATIEAFDPDSGAVTPAGNVSVARRGAKTVVLGDGRILVIGGETPSGYSAVVDIYNPGTGIWSTSNLTNGRSQFATCMLPGGDVLAIGGRNGSGKLKTVERFDGSSWSLLPTSMNTARAAFGAAWIESENRVLVVGGLTGTDGSGDADLAACETYDPELGVWETSAALNKARGYHGVAAFDNGLVLAYGGLANYSFSKACEWCRYAVPASDWYTHWSDSASAAIVVEAGNLSLQSGETYYIQVRAYDTAGNAGDIVASDGVLVDFAGPTVTVTAPTSPTNANPMVFTVTFSEDVTGFDAADLVVGNATVAGITASSASVYLVSLTPTADGDVTLAVLGGAATDTAGNANAASATATATYKSIGPACLLTGPATPTKLTTLAFTATFAEAVTGFTTTSKISVTNGRVTSAPTSSNSLVFSFSVTPLAEGDVVVQVLAGAGKDSLGNNSLASNTVTVTFDATAPTAVLTNAPATLTGTASLDVTVGGVGVVKYTYSLDGAAESGSILIANHITAGPLADGSHTLRVWGIDAAGNKQLSATTVTWTIDTVAPIATLSGKPSNPSTSDSIDLTVGGTGVVSYTYDLDGAGETSSFGVIAHLTEDSLAEGEHTLQVWGKDAAGNKQSVPTVLVWTVDTVAPTATLVSLSGSVTFASPILYRMTFDEDVADFTASDLTVNGTVVNFGATSAHDYTFGVVPTVSRGIENTVTVTLASDKVHDVAGNSCTGDSVSVLYYTEPPARVTLVASATEVGVGDSFTVSVYVKELSDSANGFRGGPLDLNFAKYQAQVVVGAGGFDPESVLDQEFTDIYTSGTLDQDNGLIDELGGVTTSNNLGEGELVGEDEAGVLYAVVPFVAVAPGKFTMLASEAAAGLTLTPPVGTLPVELVDYGDAVEVLVSTGVTLSVVDDVLSFSEEDGTATVQVSLGAAATEDVTVALAFAGTATLGTDYSVDPMNVVIASGNSTGTATLTGLHDTEYEGAEAIVVSISSVTSTSGAYKETGTQEVALAITDDDHAPGDLASPVDGEEADGKVDQYDLNEFLGHYGSHAGPPMVGDYSEACDLDVDGDVDFYDLNIFIGLYGTDYGTTRRSTAVASTVRSETSTAVVTLVGPSEVALGDTFSVDVYIETNDSNGLGSGFLDLQFTTALADFSGTFDTDTIVQYPYNSIATAGTLDESAGLIDELFGGTTKSGKGYGSPVLFASLPFKATAPGVVVFQSAAADATMRILNNGEVPLANTTFGSLTVTVTTDDVAPVADDLTVATDTNTAVTCTLTASDEDGDALQFSLPEDGAPAHGTAVFARDSASVIYTPEADFTGTDSFTFGVTDGILSDTGTVTVRVGGFTGAIQVLRGASEYATLTYGCKAGASEEGLADDGDLPAASLPGETGAYFQVSGGDSSYLWTDYRPLATTTVWQLCVVVPGTETWGLSWDGTGLPGSGAAYLVACNADWEIAGSKTDLREAGGYELANASAESETFHFLVVVSDPVEVTYNLNRGWNLIGVPVDADADSVAAFLADENIWTVYEWSEATGYKVASTLEAGRGYWVYSLGSDVTLTLVGIPQVGGVTLTAGWNLVSAGTSSGSGSPEGESTSVVASWLWSATGMSYAKPDSGIPANSGVWIYVSEDTVIWNGL